ncbi:MAG: SUMF1/EgtB/PvdO family nonheme iron enzyme [Caldilineaceae bacterium]
MAPFSRGQIRQFVEHWYAQRASALAEDEEKATLRANQLKEAIFANPRLYELAERPLLLTLTAGIHAFRQGALPQGRAELYDEAVTLLLMRWEDRIVRRNSRGEINEVVQPSLSTLLKVKPEQLLAMLQELAFEAHLHQPDLQGTAGIEEGKLLAALRELLTKEGNPAIARDDLIHYLKNRTGLLVERKPGTYAMPHRTFQEFLAACYLERIGFPYQIAELTRHEPNRWREVALLTAARARNHYAIWGLVEKLSEPVGSSTPTWPPVANAAQWGMLLSGQAVEESIAEPDRQREPERLRHLRQQLVTVVEGDALPASERALAGRILAKLNDPRSYVLSVSGMEFCLVPKGDFYRTSDIKQTSQLATLDYDFWMARFPVSQAQFAEFVAAAGYRQPRYWQAAIADSFWTPAGFKGDYDDEVRTAPYSLAEPFCLPNHPVVALTWYEAVAFCAWLSEQLAQSGWQVRLPTELEWEKSAKGGLELPEQVVKSSVEAWQSGKVAEWQSGRVQNMAAQRAYPWGEEPTGEVANYAASKIGTTSALGCFAKGSSPYSVEELYGTIWEWNNDESSPGWKVLRGNAYHSDDLPPSARVGNNPDYGFDYDGFRCVCVPISR